MLLNNLDPEVAEHPEQLVVYGGTRPRGALARRAAHDRRDAAPPARRRDAARPERQGGRRLPHARGRAARADRELAARPALGDLGRVPPAGGARADDVRADDRRLVDLHRHAGDPPGHVPDLRRRGRGALRLARPRRPDDAHGRARRDGRRAAARGDDGGRGDSLRRGRPLADRAAARDAVPRRVDGLARRRARPRARAAAAERRALSVGLLGNAADVVPELARRGERFDLVTDQTAAHDPLTGYVPAGLSRRGGGRAARDDPDGYLALAPARRSRAHVEAMLAFARAGATCSTTATTSAARRSDARRTSDAFDVPGLRARVRPAALLPRHRAVPLGCALGRPGGHRRDRRRAAASSFRTTRSCSAGSTLAPEKVAFQGLPARICWLGYGDRARGRARDQRARPARGACRRRS